MAFSLTSGNFLSLELSLFLFWPAISVRRYYVMGRFPGSSALRGPSDKGKGAMSAPVKAFGQSPCHGGIFKIMSGPRAPRRGGSGQEQTGKALSIKKQRRCRLRRGAAVYNLGVMVYALLGASLAISIPSPHGQFSGNVEVPDSSWERVIGEEKAVLAVLSLNLMVALEKGEVVRAFLFSGGDSLYHGPKTRQGDEKTPCGLYRLYRRTWSRFPWPVLIDYPGIGDAEKALAEGRISRATYNEIVRAHQNGQIPPQNTALGGAILIHGYPNPDEWQGVWWKGRIDNWTNGCLAPGNQDAEWLFNWIQDGTRILILEDARVDSLMLNGQDIDPEKLKELIRL
ncbi:MAG: L,D-transpeptidase [candidate division WOR-3 bacterium]